MKLLNFKLAINLVHRRNYGHKKFLRMKRMRDHSYTPWKSAEVVESIEETLKTPYKQVTPSNAVKRISRTNPANHCYEDIGKFYTISEEDKRRYFYLNGMPATFAELCKIFNETTLMVRKPALEIIDYLKNANYDKLPVKYVIYGQIGCGKRLTRLHINHYAFRNEFVVVDFPAVKELFIYGRKEANVSENRPPFVNLPLEGALFLKRFELQNATVLDDLKLKTSKEYVWNSKEFLPAESPLTTLISYGINRVKYSCDCIDALVQELKLAATNGQIKVLISIDGINSFFADKTMIQIDRKFIDARETTIFQSLRKFFEPNWNNGAIVMTVCEKSTRVEYRGSIFPFFLLRREGFEMLDPFVPIEVPKLSELEFHSLLDYYEDRGWLQITGAREDLEFLSSRIPGILRQYCSCV